MFRSAMTATVITLILSTLPIVAAEPPPNSVRETPLDTASDTIREAGTTLTSHLNSLHRALETAPDRVLPEKWQSLELAAKELENKTAAAISLRDRVLKGSDMLSRDAMNLRGAFAAIEAEFLELAQEAEGEAGPAQSAGDPNSSLPQPAFQMLAQEAAAHRRAAELTRDTAERFMSVHQDLREKLHLLAWADRPLKRIRRASQNYHRLAELGGTLEEKQAELKHFANELNAVLQGLDDLNSHATKVVSLIQNPNPATDLQAGVRSKPATRPSRRTPARAATLTVGDYGPRLQQVVRD